MRQAVVLLIFRDWMIKKDVLGVEVGSIIGFSGPWLGYASDS